MKGKIQRILGIFCVLVMLTTGVVVIIPNNVTATDWDGDGLSDWDEINVYGSRANLPNTDWPEDDIDDGNLDFDTSKVLICDQEANTILETIPMSRSEITSSGEAIQNPLLVYGDTREKENIEFMEQLTYSPQEINIFETVPQTVDQNQPQYDQHAGMSGTLVAQSFIQEHETLSSVDLRLRRHGIEEPSNNNIIVEIREDFEGLPSDTIKTSISLSICEILEPGQERWVNFDFPDVSASVGTSYWIVVNMGDAQSPNFISLYYSSIDVYPFGRVAWDYYGEWSYAAAHLQDLAFRTYYLHYPQLVDQSQPQYDEGASMSGTLVAQSFIQEHETLSSVDLRLRRHGIGYPTNNDIIVEIREDSGGFPSDTTILTSTSLSMSEILEPGQERWVNFDFPDVSASVGTSYWIVVNMGVSQGGYPFISIHYSYTDLYPFGRFAWFYHGEWCHPPSTKDLAFRTYYLYSQQVPDQIQAEWNLMQPISENQMWAQSFTPTYETLSSIDLCLFQVGNPPNDYAKVEIREDEDGVPSDFSLRSAMYPSLDYILGSEAPTWISFDFQDITVSPDTQYWIVLSTGPDDLPNSYNGFTIFDEYDIYVDGDLVVNNGGEWDDIEGDMAFRTNYAYDVPTGEISLNFLHKISWEMGISPTLQPIDEYLFSYWIENEYGPQNIVVANQDLFMPYAATYAHRTYSAFFNDIDKALCFFKISTPYAYSHPLSITYFGDDQIMMCKLQNLALLYNIPFNAILTIPESEIALTPISLLPTQHLPTQQIHTHQAVTVIHNSDNSALPNKKQYWKIAPIFCAMRQTMLITASGTTVFEIDSSITSELHNHILPNNNGQFPEYLIISSHWNVIPYKFCQEWEDWGYESTFKTYYSESGVDQSQTECGGIGGDLAQSFVPTYDTLSSVELYLRRTGSPTDTTVEIRSSDENMWPSDDILVSVSKPMDELPYSTRVWVKFDFPDISVTPGTTYWIVVYLGSHIDMGITCYDSYPYGRGARHTLKDYSADYVYADLNDDRFHYLPDMTVGRLTSYHITTTVLLMNRGPFFDTEKMIEGHKAVMAQWSIAECEFAQMREVLEQMYGTDNVWDWDSEEHEGDPADLEDVLNEVKMAEFVYLHGHAGAYLILATLPYLYGLDILDNGICPPSLWFFNGCASGIYWQHTSDTTLIEGATRSGAVNIISTVTAVGGGWFQYEYVSHLEQGYDHGTAWTMALYDLYNENIPQFIHMLWYYSIGDPMVNYGS